MIRFFSLIGLVLILSFSSGFSACQGIMLGGNGSIGAGAGAGGGDDADLGDDTTNFRPTALPPALDDPGVSISATLTIVTGGAARSPFVNLTLEQSGRANLAGTATITLTAAPVVGQEVIAVHQRPVSSGVLVDLEELRTTTDVSGRFSLTTSNAFLENDQFWLAAADNSNGGSNTLVFKTQPRVVSVKIGDTSLTDGATVSSLNFDIKWDDSMDPTTINASNVNLVCASAITLSLGGTFPATDTIDNNEVTARGTAPASSQECTLTIGVGNQDLSSNSQASEIVRTFTFTQASSGTGSSGTTSGGSGGSSSTVDETFSETFQDENAFADDFTRFLSSFWAIDPTGGIGGGGLLTFTAGVLSHNPNPSGSNTAPAFVRSINPSSVALTLEVSGVTAMDSGSNNSYLIDGVWLFVGSNQSTLETILDNHIAIGWTVDPDDTSKHTCFARKVVDGAADGLIDLQTQAIVGGCDGTNSLFLRISREVSSFDLAYSTDGNSFTTLTTLSFNGADEDGEARVGVYFSTSNSSGTFSVDLAELSAL